MPSYAEKKTKKVSFYISNIIPFSQSRGTQDSGLITHFGYSLRWVKICAIRFIFILEKLVSTKLYKSLLV